jgi:hypothetical protein
MTVNEISNEFDVLAQSAASSPANWGYFNEYEKSVFLTKAQEQIVIAAYTGNLNGTPYEGSEELRQYLRAITVEKTLSLKDEDDTVVADYPDDLMFVVEEDAMVDGKRAIVVPIKQDHLFKILNNPFRGPNLRRLIKEDIDNKIVLHYNDKLSGKPEMYNIKYIRRPQPIVLQNIGDLEIEGVSTVSECELNEILQRKIIDLAVRMALQSKGVTQ